MDVCKYYDFEDDASQLVFSTALEPASKWLWLPPLGEEWPTMMVEMKIPTKDNASAWSPAVVTTVAGHLMVLFEGKGKGQVITYPIGAQLTENDLCGRYVLDAATDVDPMTLVEAVHQGQMGRAWATFQGLIDNLAWGTIDIDVGEPLDVTQPPFKVMAT